MHCKSQLTEAKAEGAGDEWMLKAKGLLGLIEAYWQWRRWQLSSWICGCKYSENKPKPTTIFFTGPWSHRDSKPLIKWDYYQNERHFMPICAWSFHHKQAAVTDAKLSLEMACANERRWNMRLANWLISEHIIQALAHWTVQKVDSRHNDFKAKSRSSWYSAAFIHLIRSSCWCLIPSWIQLQRTLHAYWRRGLGLPFTFGPFVAFWTLCNNDVIGPKQSETLYLPKASSKCTWCPTAKRKQILTCMVHEVHEGMV